MACPLVAKGVTGAHRGTQSGYGPPMRGKPRLMPAGKWVHASVLYQKKNHPRLAG